MEEEQDLDELLDSAYDEDNNSELSNSQVNRVVEDDVEQYEGGNTSDI